MDEDPVGNYFDLPREDREAFFEDLTPGDQELVQSEVNKRFQRGHGGGMSPKLVLLFILAIVGLVIAFSGISYVQNALKTATVPAPVVCPQKIALQKTNSVNVSHGTLMIMQSPTNHCSFHLVFTENGQHPVSTDIETTMIALASFPTHLTDNTGAPLTLFVAVDPIAKGFVGKDCFNAFFEYLPPEQKMSIQNCSNS